MGDGHPFDQQQENSIGEDGQRLVTSEDYEVRIIEPAQPGGNWEAKAAIKMHLTENALTVRIVSIKVCFIYFFWIMDYKDIDALTLHIVHGSCDLEEPPI